MRSLEEIARDFCTENDSKKKCEFAEEMHEALKEPCEGQRLLATCTNLSCGRQFHVIPNNQDQSAFFNTLVAAPNAYGQVRIVLVCPYCELHLQILASTLQLCSCGREPHANSAA